MEDLIWLESLMKSGVLKVFQHLQWILVSVYTPLKQWTWLKQDAFIHRVIREKVLNLWQGN